MKTAEKGFRLHLDLGPEVTSPRARTRPHARYAIGRALLLTASVDTVLAGFFALALGQPFQVCLVYSQAIGLSICLLSFGAYRLLGAEKGKWQASLVAIPLGGVIGIAIGRFWESGYALPVPLGDPRTLAAALVGAVICGAAMSYYFHSQVALARGRAELREELLRRAEDAQRITEAELKLLQAQIEPHFLFNTLSNVLQLLEADPQAARRMLMNLTSYLRASLRRTRSGATTLDEELELVRAYLEIQQVRMGARLAYRIDCPPELRDLPLPPLLLQPLVENAVQHGLEPRPSGGEVTVCAAREEGALVLEVKDTGVGLAADHPPGLGLGNVRARLRALAEGQGTLVLKPSPPHGLCVRLTLPLKEGVLGRAG